MRRCRNLSDDGERRRRTTHELQTTAAVRADESRDLRRKLLDRITSAASSASRDACSSRNFQRDENFDCVDQQSKNEFLENHLNEF